MAERRFEPGARGADANAARCRIFALGSCRIMVDDRAVELRSRKALAIMVYLLLNGSGAESRERLCGLLWSESAEARARSSLRQVLHGLKDALEPTGYDGLAFERERVRLDPGSIRFDLSDILAALDKGVMPTTLGDRQRPADDVLAGFDGLDPAFDVWIAVQRRLLVDRMERGLQRVMEGAPQTQERIAAATALINLDPTNELACRQLMAAHADRGEAGAALRIYKQLWDHLEQEYDVEPAPETQALAVRLKSEPSPVAIAALPPAPRPAPTQRVVVVAPFDTRGVDKANAYLVTGLRLDFLAKLVRFREWLIVDAQQLKDTDPRAFADRWPEQIWIDLFIVQSGERLKATLSVREEPDGRLIWSETFRFGMDAWFDMEREVLARLAATMNLHISTARLIASAGKPEVSLEVYDRWLRGQAIIMNWRPERERARAIYRSILDEAPSFSPAWSGMAQIESAEHLRSPGVLRTREREQAGLDFARNAVRYDPLDSRAHLALGWASAMNGLFEESYAAFVTALDLNANDFWTLNSAALGTAYCGEVENALALIEHSLGLGITPSPFHFAYQGVVRFLAGDYERTVRLHDLSQNVLPDLAGWRAAALHFLGREAEAREAARTFLSNIRERWAGDAPPTDESIAAWFLHSFPIRDRKVWERLRDGVAAAGVPVPPEAAIPRHP